MRDDQDTMRCDECGRDMAKAHRRHKGQRYCTICYARLFKHRMCPKCGNMARLPKNDENAVCIACERNKPCIRCGKVDYAIGKITDYGPVCNSCAHYFREPKPCGLCGTLSSRLTRVKRAGITVPVCPKCAHRDHGTCPDCRRHRLLLKAPDDRMVCKICLEKGEVPCPSCGNRMPAGRGKICETCYWDGLFRKRLQINLSAFSVCVLREQFAQFGDWLLKEIGGHKSALSLHRYLHFFLEMEKRWQRIPSYPELLEGFGAEKLRRLQVPMRWLNQTKAIVSDAATREQDSDRRRIEAILSSLTDRNLALLLNGYREQRMIRVAEGKATLRSVRLALRPAASLLLLTGAAGLSVPNQALLNQYLAEAPGQRAAITGFIHFLNEKYPLGLVAQTDESRIRKARKKKLEAEMQVLIQASNEDTDFRRKWLSVALAYFHDLPRKVGNNLREQDIAGTRDEGLTITWNKAQYWVPYP